MQLSPKQFINWSRARNADIFIGVDPSGAKTELNKNGTFKPGRIGLCIIDRNNEFLHFDAVNFFEFQKITRKYIKETYPDATIHAVVEQPDGQGAYNRASIKNRETFGRQNRDLGKNQFASNLIVSWLKWLGVSVEEKTPKQKGAKWAEITFRARSGWREALLVRHGHAIDAYQLVFPYLNTKKKKRTA